MAAVLSRFALVSLLVFSTATAGAAGDASPGPQAQPSATAPAAATAPSGPHVGEPAPDFNLRTLDGKSVTLQTYRGKTLVINAWATWCPPCREEMPDYVAAAPVLAKKGVVVLGVDTTEGEPVVRAYAVAKAVPYALAVTRDDAFGSAYDVHYFPTTFIVDPQGVLRARIVDVVTRPQLASFVRTAQAERNVVIISALQRRIEATLNDPALTFDGDATSVEANARKAIAIIARAEKLLDDASAKDGTVDFVRTRAGEAALRERALAALDRADIDPADATLRDRLHASAALDDERWRDAAGFERAVLALAPRDADALDGLAQASYEAHDYASGVDAETKLAALDPQDVGTLVALARVCALAGDQDEATRIFARAVTAARRQVALHPHDALALRMLAYAYLYAGRTAATSGNRAVARGDFDEVVRLAARLPAHDARHDMYLEEGQEAIVALGLASGHDFSVSLAPWTGADLPGSLASTYKYRLAVAGTAGRNVSLVTASVPKRWVASFCNDNACAPFRTSFALPPSGVKIVEFQLVPPEAGARLPKVRVLGKDGAHVSSATT